MLRHIDVLVLVANVPVDIVPLVVVMLPVDIVPVDMVPDVIVPVLVLMPPVPVVPAAPVPVPVPVLDVVPESEHANGVSARKTTPIHTATPSCCRLVIRSSLHAKVTTARRRSAPRNIYGSTFFGERAAHMLPQVAVGRLLSRPDPRPPLPET
jgi:hypothetical protein